jgi:quercetin dioxygenase-like cupin family protein
MTDQTRPRHIVARAAEAAFAVPGGYASHSQGYTRWSVVDDAVGSVHMGFGVCALDAGGSIATHAHSFEESFHVLEGEAIIDTAEGSYALRAGDYGVVPVGMPHAWRNTGGAAVRWADMLAPQPRADASADTFFVADLPMTQTAVPVDPRDPRTRWMGHIDPANMEVDQQTQDRLAVSASMRTALLVYSGITVKMMVDTDLGAQLSTMFMVQYVPGGFAGAHDHPLEEAYLVTEGRVDAVFDGQRYRLEVGDVAWAGVGCVHEFSNPGPGIVRWLETQAPQPPARHSYRFARDWAYLRDTLSTD